MVNLKFSAFVLTLCLLLTSCVCETNTTTSSCTIQDTIATCESNEDFKSLQQDVALNISKLIVRSEKLKRITKDDLAVLVNVEEIDLANCGLEEIDENAFVDFKKLHKINLAGNTKLQIANDKSFINSDTLTCLNLSNTNVVDGISETFVHLPQLVNLDLSGTNVKDFTFLESLKHLAKLVISKSNATLELCNLVHDGKEVIEKDENGTEATLDCKTKKDATVAGEVTTEKEVNATKEEAPSTTEAAATTIENEEPTTISPSKIEEPKTGEPKIEEPKIGEPKTGEPKIGEPKIGEPKIEEPKLNETTEITNKTELSEAKPKLLHESSEEKETTTTVVVIIPKEEENGTTIEEHTEKGTNEETTPIGKLEENTNKTENLRVAPKIEETKVANENPQVVLESSDDVILPSTANTSSSNGVNIVLGIILCVMIVGAVGFGFKYWKNRRSGYTHANTHDHHDDEDKELQTIVAHRTEPEQN